jgi:hypothetical protein
MRKFITVAAVVAVLALFAGNAMAQCGYGGFGGYGGYSGYGHGHSYGHSHVQPHTHWHDTSHWDYHPAQIVPHGNHYHVQPGHYHFHQTGHYDLHW